MNDNSPLVSVVMSVFNGETLLDKSIKSILAQTFTDFEFIIIDDGSTDKTPDIIKKYETDGRVIVITQENIGLTKSLNKAIKIARGELIARQDADDISLKERLLCLVNEFKKNPALVLCGTRAVIKSGELSYESKIKYNITIHLYILLYCSIKKNSLKLVCMMRNILQLKIMMHG